MKLITIESEKQLNDFVGGQKHSQFLQSWEWGEFQKQVSGLVWRIGVEDNSGEIIATAKIIKKSLPMGKSYFYCGRGPEFKGGNWDNQAGKILFDEIKRLAAEEGAMFLRFDPTFSMTDIDFLTVKTLDIQPSKTLVLDLDKSQEDLLKEMHQKTRYNIKLAEKKGVKIVEADVSRFEEFWTLMAQTGDRDEFSTHGRSYYQAMLNLPKDFLKLFFGEYKGKPLVGNIMVFFGDTVSYIHGGSANENRELMAPHLLQWHTIRLAKELGYRYYDMCGISEERWPGVTRFKEGFGGREINYPGTFDAVYDEGWYSIYKMVRQVRRSF